MLYFKVTFKGNFSDNIAIVSISASSLGFRWRMGTQVIVFLHDYKMSREAFTRPEFVDRPDWLVFNFKEEKALGELLQRFLIFIILRILTQIRFRGEILYILVSVNLSSGRRKSSVIRKYMIDNTQRHWNEGLSL